MKRIVLIMLALGLGLGLVVGISGCDMELASDIWPSFRHDLRHTGQSVSRTPDRADLIWNYAPADVAHSSPAVKNDKVYIGSDDGSIYGLDQDDGALIWSYETGD